MHINKQTLLLKNDLGKGISAANYKSADEEEAAPQPLGVAIKGMIDNIIDPTAGMSEEKKAAFEKKIEQKIKNGEKLSADELRYLQLHNPEMYAQISRVQAQRENLESRLRNCESKEEVEIACSEMKLQVDPADPAREALLAAYEDAAKEFKKSGEYERLPQTVEEGEQNNRAVSSKSEPIKEDKLEEAYLNNGYLNVSYINCDA